jgi:hypothetical protein
MIPWTIYPELMPSGFVEREVRNKGCGLTVDVSSCIEEISNVKVMEEGIWENGRRGIKKTYITPVGSVSEKTVAETQYFGSLDWFSERIIKSLADYPVVEFIINNTVYHPNYDVLLKAEQFLGNDGVVFARVDYPPLLKLVIHYMGIERFALDLHDHPAEVEKLLKCMEKKQDQMYQVAADAPVIIIRARSNLTSELVSPALFEKYLLPFYNKQASLLHRKNKVFAVHMDGKLRHLAHLIAKADIDIIEAFTPPPMGDLSLREARRVWKDKLIWANFPASICCGGEREITQYLGKLLKEIAPGDNFILEFSEDVPQELWAQTLTTVASAMLKYGTY